MTHPIRWSLLSTLAISLLVAWLALAAGPPEVASPMPSRFVPAAGSLYPAPQVDESAPPVEPPPTF
jgi:hypothetical protein